MTYVCTTQKQISRNKIKTEIIFLFLMALYFLTQSKYKECQCYVIKGITLKYGLSSFLPWEN